MIEETPDGTYEKPWIRHAILWTGFAIMVVVGVWTVVLPAVEDSPVDPTLSGESENQDEPETTENTSDSED